jgi:adenosylcobinamide kinase / adenosylcobinamide-phosphate guanylyltransferase
LAVLVLGGIRSGKSRWAESLIANTAGPDSVVRYLATGATLADAEWSARVAVHRERRPPHWSTVECTDVATQLRADDAATLVDDVGGWLTAAMDRRDAWNSGSAAEDVDELAAAVAAFRGPLVLVSPEVGLSVVPATESGRRFTDELGVLNQRLAALCECVVLVVAGLPVTIKGVLDD